MHYYFQIKDLLKKRRGEFIRHFFWYTKFKFNNIFLIGVFFDETPHKVTNRTTMKKKKKHDKQSKQKYKSIKKSKEKNTNTLKMLYLHSYIRLQHRITLWLVDSSKEYRLSIHNISIRKNKDQCLWEYWLNEQWGVLLPLSLDLVVWMLIIEG